MKTQNKYLHSNILVLVSSLMAFCLSTSTKCFADNKEDPSRYGLSGSFCDLEGLKWKSTEPRTASLLETFVFNSEGVQNDPATVITRKEVIKTQAKNYLFVMMTRYTGVTLNLNELQEEPTKYEFSLSLIQKENLYSAVCTGANIDEGYWHAGKQTCSITVEKLIKRGFEEARKLQCEKLVNECRSDTLFSPFSAERKAWYNTVRMDCT